MRIELFDNYVVTSDSKQYILNKRKVNKKTDEEYLSQISYFVRIEDLFKHIANRKLLSSKAKTVEELLRDVKKIRKMIENNFSLDVGKFKKEDKNDI